MFSGCSSLTSLPNISCWKCNSMNINFIEQLFYGCSSLISLPNISKWKLKFLNNNFDKCLSLISLPELTFLGPSKLKNCLSLLNLPEESEVKQKVNIINDNNEYDNNDIIDNDDEEEEEDYNDDLIKKYENYFTCDING